MAGLGVASSIVGGVMDFFNSAINNMWADDRSRKDRQRDWYYYQLQSSLDHQYNVAAMEKAQQINKQQYDYEYAKESPSARKAQYLSAGLNPGLMYSNGLAGMQGSVGSVQPATSRGNMPNKSMPFNPIGMVDLMDNILKASQSKSEESDARLKEAEKLKTEQETVNLKLDEARKAVDNARAEIERIDAQLKQDITKEERDNLIATRDEQRRKIKVENDNIESLTKKNEELTKRLKELTPVEKENIEQDTATKNALEGKYTEETKTEKSKRTALDAQAQRDLSQADWNDVRRILDETYGDKERSMSIGKIEAEIAKLREEPELLRSLRELNETRSEYTEKDFYLRVGQTILNALHGRRSNNITEEHYKNSDKKSPISAENVISLGRLLLPYLLKAV